MQSGSLSSLSGVLDGAPYRGVLSGVRMPKTAYHPMIEPQLGTSAQGFHRWTPLS